MDAIVLVGGLGTRLRSLISEVPKPMAPIGDRPFLDILLQDLSKSPVITRIILAVGYKHEVVQSYFGKAAYARDVIYSVESEPLGTGGAIRQALNLALSDDVLILNGDTLFQVDISEIVAHHQWQQADLTMALKPMRDFDRYGVVNLAGSSIESQNQGRITGFEEKRPRKEGLINGGIYLMSRDIFSHSSLNSLQLSDKFSFETDFLQPCIEKIQVHGFVSEGYFIDIGIPEDYRQAEQTLNEVVSKQCDEPNTF